MRRGVTVTAYSISGRVLYSFFSTFSASSSQVYKEWMHPIKRHGFSLIVISFLIHSMLVIDHVSVLGEVSRQSQKETYGQDRLGCTALTNMLLERLLVALTAALW